MSIETTLNTQLSFWSGDILKKPIVNLISGKISAGKTTLANMLKSIFSKKFTDVRVLSFASPIKDCAIDYLGWNGEKDEKGRVLLQKLGQIGRDYNENTWVNFLLGRLDDVVPPDIIIVEDWRFPNEFIAFKNTNMYDIVTIRVLRRDLPSNARRRCGGPRSARGTPRGPRRTRSPPGSR